MLCMRVPDEKTLQHPWLAVSISKKALAGKQKNLKKNYSRMFKKSIKVVRVINTIFKFANSKKIREPAWE